MLRSGVQEVGGAEVGGEGIVVVVRRVIGGGEGGSEGVGEVGEF